MLSLPVCLISPPLKYLDKYQITLDKLPSTGYYLDRDQNMFSDLMGRKDGVLHGLSAKL